MTKEALLAVSIATLAGCAGVAERVGLDRLGLGAPATESEANAPLDPFARTAEGAGTDLAPETAAPPPLATAQTAEALDTTTPEQRAAAAAPASEGGQQLGRTSATLGSPTEPGLWLKTPLVEAERQGRVTNPANGKSSLVTLIPLEGPTTGGSRMSLAAMRLIGLPLTDIAEVDVSLEG